MANLQLRVYVPPHPSIKHWLAIVRDADSPMPLFRTAIGELSHWLTYEAAREWLPTQLVQVQTPLTPCDAEIIDVSQPIAIVPVLRAGLAMVDKCQAILSNSRVYHLGFKRDETTLESSCYLNRLPDTFAANTRVAILEPMLATGGTIVQTLQELEQRGADISLVRILSIIASAPALKRIGETYPSLQIYTATIDEHLNEQGFIVPGLGDAGDRAFGTED
ncbi:MAG: uracil phosphoribosyltransferase [Cyanobacteria bacterium P01_G01_bin.4]